MGDQTPKDETLRAEFHLELKDLKERLLALAGLAEQAMERSVTAFLNQDRDLARQVINGDAAINSLEEAIDGECVRLIALFQPVAIDLRQVIAVDHIIPELERIGDSATNVAEEVLTLERFPPRPCHEALPRMGKMSLRCCAKALRPSLTMIPTWPGRSAWPTTKWTPGPRHHEDLLKDMAAHRKAVPTGQCQINIVRNLERVGDHATNIAEQVVYMVEGESIRHRCQG